LVARRLIITDDDHDDDTYGRAVTNNGMMTPFLMVQHNEMVSSDAINDEPSS
jgi:hypothetical protein